MTDWGKIASLAPAVADARSVIAFDLRVDERTMLFQALQLQAQAAVEAVRAAAESGTEISDKEIEAEIRAVRKKS